MPKREMSNTKRSYSGFWMRLIANVIDCLIFVPISIFLPRALFLIDLSFLLYIFLMIFLTFLLDALYEILLTYRFGGTLGKLLLGIRVVDERGKNISLGRSIGRYFAKYVSELTLGVGFLMIAFTKKKQGLHDMMAKTYVINSKNSWQNRRKYVIIAVIILLAAYIIYLVYVMIMGIAFAIQYSTHKIDQSNPISDIRAYCGNQTYYGKDTCYEQYITTGNYLDYENQSTKIALCNEISDDGIYAKCIMNIAMKEYNASVCGNSRSAYTVKVCKSAVEFTTNMMSAIMDEYEITGYNDSLTAESMKVGYVANNDCIQNDISSYTYGDEACILPKNVKSFKIGKDGKHWYGTTLYLSKQGSKSVAVFRDIFNADMNLYLPDDSYNGRYSHFTIGDMPAGDYTLNYTIYDLIGKQKISLIKNITVSSHPDYGNLTLKNTVIGLDYNAEMCYPYTNAFERYSRICLQPTVKGFQKLPDGLYDYNMDIEILNDTSSIYYTEQNIFDNQEEALVDSTINGPYAIVYAKDYPEGNYTFKLTVKDIVSRKTVVVTQPFTIRG